MNNILVKKIILSAFVLLVMILIYNVINKTLNKLFGIKKLNLQTKKQKTIKKFFVNFVRILLIIISILIILEIFDIKTSAIITSLGAATVVIGLAFQDILKDFIAGISFIFDNSYSIGDWVTINGFKGEVLSIGIKSTRIKAYSGEILIINNGSIKEVINHTASNSMAIVDVGVSYDSNIEKVDEILKKLCLKLNNQVKYLKGEITVLGIEQLASSSVVYRITAEVEAGKQYEVQRILRKEIKLELDKNNIEIPYEQMVIHNA